MFPFDRIKTLRTRLILLVLAATVLAAALVGGTLTLLNYGGLREAAVTDLRAQADVIAAQSTAVLEFDDPTSAIESLHLLRVVPEIGGAWIYKPGGELFASFVSETHPSPVFSPGAPGERKEGEWIVRSRPIIRDNDVLGTLVMSYDLGPLLLRIRNGVLMSIGLGTISAAVALLLAIRMQRIVSRPIAELADVAHSVSRTGDFAIRARKYGDDELGGLTDVINEMLTRTQQQAQEIKAANEKFRVAVESAPNAIVKYDDHGRIVLVNQQTERLFDYSRDELLGQSVEVLVPERFRAQFPGDSSGMFFDAKARPKGAMGDIFGRRKDGTEFPIAIAFNPIDTDEGRRVLCSIVDITERRRQEEALRESQERLALAQAAGRVGTFDWNMKSDQVIWSPESEAMFGMLAGASNRSYQAWKTCVHPEDRERADREVMAAIQHHTDLKSEYRVVWPDGSVHWIMASGRGIYNDSGEPIRLLGVNVDITERKRAEEERAMLLESERAARNDAERASRMKDEFVATLSHELRTPMTAVLGWAQMLRRGGKKPVDLAQGLEVIERNARVQSQIIEDLLDMSRIISGKVRLDVQQVDLREVIEEALTTVRPAAQAKEIGLQAVLDPRVGPVRGDPNRLQQIVWNLLSNAIKFTPRNGRVQISLARVNSHVEITVSDTGQGIAEEFLPHVFERFRQADASTTRRQGGLGLGLAIVKQLVELHGGYVAVASPGANQGATFTVTLPLSIVHSTATRPVGEELAHPRHARVAPVAESVSLKGTNVLIVEDEPDARELIARLLEQHDASVMRSSSAMEALSVLEHFKPDVLVSDIGMPDHDGYDFIRRVRALDSSRGGDTPAVALTAFARSEDRTRALLAGYQMHVAKPVEPAELLAAIATVASVGRRADRAEPSINP